MRYRKLRQFCIILNSIVFILGIPFVLMTAGDMDDNEVIQPDNLYFYPIMKPDHDTFLKWVNRYNNALQLTYIPSRKLQMMESSETSNFSLLSYLDYVPNVKREKKVNCMLKTSSGFSGIHSSLVFKRWPNNEGA